MGWRRSACPNTKAIAVVGLEQYENRSRNVVEGIYIPTAKILMRAPYQAATRLIRKRK